MARRPVSKKKTSPRHRPGAGAVKKTAPSKPGSHPKVKADSPKPSVSSGKKPRATAPRLPNARQAKILLNLEEILSRRIVGKDDAVARIARVVRVRMTQLDFRPNRPKGTFLLVGPSGVGKNELAYALGQALHGTDDRVVSIDLGELTEEGDVVKLGVTLLPGTTNQAVEGILASPIRRDPEAIVLLRGLERAHASFQPILQQVLERGVMEDLIGSVSFSRTVIFVTTRPRRDEPAGVEIGFSRSASSPEEVMRRRLERNINPELIESFNEVIEIPPLNPDAVRRIARYKVEAVLARLQQRRRKIAVADNVFEAFLPDEEANREGIALLHRTLEDRLFNPLARYLLSHPGNRSLQVEVIEGSLQIHE
jgi:ATP-dependent Clp protease ATP-binding subunit ClpA